jgi:hypothetical protein
MMTDPSETSTQPMGVVVAEDEVQLRMHAVEALTEKGFVAIEAGHATAALEICKSRADEVDVLFTEIRMPGVNGRPGTGASRPRALARHFGGDCLGESLRQHRRISPRELGFCPSQL